MWRQSKLLNLRLWNGARHASEQTWLTPEILLTGRQRHYSVGKRKIKQLEHELRTIKATSLEQLQRQVKQQVSSSP